MEKSRVAIRGRGRERRTMQLMVRLNGSCDDSEVLLRRVRLWIELDVVLCNLFLVVFHKILLFILPLR